jgi:hypothetical protein
MAQRALNITIGLLIAVMLGCWAAAGWFDHQKYALSGVPAGHFAVNENGRQFYVHRGGPPIDQRPQVLITAEQYRLWDENDQASSLWGGRGVLCLFAVVGLAAWGRIVGPGRRSDTEPDAADRGRDLGPSG